MDTASEAYLAQRISNTKVRWVIPQRLDFITFVGKQVLAIAHDIYIIFYNFKTKSEIVYTANNHINGDGVDVIAGHRSNIFVFAEKVTNPRIFVLSYPRFNQLALLKDLEVNRYKSLCMMEGDLIATFSGFPNYLLTVWNWRTQQRLVALPTGVIRRKQIYMASRTHMLVCECWGEGLIVWEVAQCYRRCLVLRRAKEEVTGWEISEPPLIDVCWTSDGQLYAIDKDANLYSVLSDGIGMVTHLEWSENLTGSDKPSVCSFGNGILIYGPDQRLRLLKKAESKWKVSWTYVMPEEVVRLVSNTSSDMAAVWTHSGRLYYITETDDKIELVLHVYRQRNIIKIQLIAPDNKYLATMNKTGEICIYEVLTGNLILRKSVEGNDISFQASPVEPLLILFGELGVNYGMGLFTFTPEAGLEQVGSMCLTHQIVSQIVFSPTGRQVTAVASSAGHIFVFQLSEQYKLTLVRYTELGRGLADSFLMKVGDSMRSFNLVLFSDKYAIGERIMCINADNGKDNKFAGKMQGPYSQLLPLAQPGCALAVPHLTNQLHVLRLSGEKGITVSVKMGPVFESGHDLKQCRGYINSAALITFSYDGTVILRKPEAPVEYESKMIVSHRYESGVQQAVVDTALEHLAHLGGNGTVAVAMIDAPARLSAPTLFIDYQPIELFTEPPALEIFKDDENINIFDEFEKNYLDIQEEKRVHTEAMDYRRAREEVVRALQAVQERAVALLEENLQAPPLHRLPISEFNLHAENKKERLKQAEKEREEIRLQTEALIRAQDKVTAWIKSQCWDSMATPRVKIFAVFTHYYVENYAVLPNQREQWPELQVVEALRALEMESDHEVFRPWEEQASPALEMPSTQIRESLGSMRSMAHSVESQAVAAEGSGSGSAEGQPYSLSGTNTHLFVAVPPAMVPQTLAYSFLHMDMLQHLALLNVQNLRLWFNHQFDDLMGLKKREVGLVQERNARLRFIVQELNTLSDLRGSFHHLIIQITDPEWRQEEEPYKLIKVDPEECSIPPYVSPSQIFIPPPPPGPPDDFRERALIEMMDGVLEKLWHEEIKKPIPKPQCMLDKDPEHFNEDDLRLVFEYEAKVAFREEERDKYRKMLHAEYAKLSQLLNEGIVKFNHKVKEMWLTRLRIDSAIGQENLNLMRLRRTNLDRIELSEEIEDMRRDIARYESEIEMLQGESQQISVQSEECTAAHEALVQKDRYFDKTFKNHFADLSPIIVEQCYKFYKKRPKWQNRAGLSASVLQELAAAVLATTRPPLLPPDALDFLRALEQLDLVSNMPPVMDENLWTNMCKLRRAKIENEMRMRAAVQEMALVDSTAMTWGKAAQARRTALTTLHERMVQHRRKVELLSRNKTIQLVLPAGQVEVVTTGHMEDFDDAALILREDIERINEVILKVGEMKLNMMRRQMEYRKGILAKEWEHAQMKMKLRHMEQELYSYQRLKIPKELQLYLKNKELGCTDEQQYVRMERDMEASRRALDRNLTELIRKHEEMELKCTALTADIDKLNQIIAKLNLRVSEKRLSEDPLQPIRVRKIFKMRMETLVARSELVREVQAQHTQLVLLQTELELLRLRTYPTLATFRTIP
ncbi:PREDICTED: cilia- and flagella-associated protein 43 [Papilio xuthus]|uniref:Cilia- and flagella-associated protein 43 n=1 Tax=Papilio xuthus TaxID=66420 RepID=A0AAJ6ZTK2_PAPXU|nr:PREDICTED: cilia- and flagella-associated protein 43 [Papilio xuthus]